jgi:thiol-disulfide isomerase/thioredoxin
LITQITVESGSTRAIIDIDVRSHNGSLDPALFILDTEGSESVPSRMQLSDRENHPLLGQPAPILRLQTVDGQSFDLSKADAELMVLDLWATWCAPCMAGLPDLQLLQDWVIKHQKPVALYTINVQEDPQAVRSVWEKMKLTLPVLVDKDGAARKALRAESLPALFVIHKGKVVDAVPSQLERLKLVIDYFLDSGSPKTVIPLE